MLHSEFVSFLALALIGGAYSDYLLSVSFKSAMKLIFGLVVAISCLVVFVIFNTSTEVHEDVKKEFTIWFSLVSGIFCLGIKSVIFYQEEFLHRKFKRR